MRLIVMFMLCCVFGLSQILYAEKDRKGEIESIVEKIVESPQEYDMPKETLDRLVLRDAAMKRAAGEVAKKEIELQLASTKLATMRLEHLRLKEAFSAEFRLFLTSKGVPYDDLPKWRIENNKAVREKDKEVKPNEQK